MLRYLKKCITGKKEYKVVGNIHPDIQFSYARASETGFKFKVYLLNYKQSNLINSPLQKEYDRVYELVDKGEITREEGDKCISEFFNKEENKKAHMQWMRENEVITRDYMYFREDEERSIEKITHITNLNGNKYTLGNSSISSVDIEGNLYEFSADFNLTKNDVTDKLNVVLIYYGEPINIELEKVK